MATTFNVISLGTFLNLDAVEGGQPENAPRLNNQTFGGQDNPLYNNIQTFAPAGAGPSGGGNPTQYEGDGDFDQFAINGGPVKTVEAFIFMPATITYIDGTTTTISGRVMQSTDLQLYLVPSISQDLSQDALEAKPILSITFGTFVPPPQNQTYVMQADRDPNELVPVVDGTSGDDVMNVGFADQTNRNAAAPRIDGNANYILAGGGNDFVAGGGGNDTIYGGDGNDTIQGGTGADALFGGAGADTLDYSDNNQAVSVNLANNTVSGGTAQGDTINGFENVVGGSGNDTLVLSNTAGSASGGAGSDTITGGSANDTLNGEAGNDVLRGGDGADRLFGGADHDTLYGDAGNDVLDGGTGNDRLFGGAGNDVLLGGAGNDTLDGGAGTDTLTGGDGADVFIADGTADLITDFGVGGGPINDDDPTNNDFVDLSAFYNPTTLAAWNAANPDRQFDKVLTWLRADYLDNGVLDQAGGLRIQNGAGALVGADALNFETTNVCFTTGTLITTPNGPVAIENLRIGDLVATADRGACAIRWIGSSRVGSVALAMNPKQRPVRIKSGALGRGLPQGDLLVSQQHRIMVHSPILEKMVGAKEGLVAAKHLVGMPGIDLADDVVAVTYWHFLLDRHEIVFAQGAAAESLFTGPVALQNVPAASRDEILALFPELAALDYTALAATAARPLINGRLGRTLVERHKKNAKHLVG